MKYIALAAALFASTLSLAQTPAAPQTRTAAQEDAAVATAADKAPTDAELQQQIKTVIAMRQVYYERLEKITEFQKYMDADGQISELEKQRQQRLAAQQRPAMSKEQEKTAAEDFKKKMAANVEREKAADAAKAKK